MINFYIRYLLKQFYQHWPPQCLPMTSNDFILIHTSCRFRINRDPCKRLPFHDIGDLKKHDLSIIILIK